MDFFLIFRHIIAAIHFNYNLQRDTQLHQTTHQNRIMVSYPKLKNGEAVVRDVKVKPNFGKFRYTSVLFY